jgi:hypothetical protein
MISGSSEQININSVFVQINFIYRLVLVSHKFCHIVFELRSLRKNLKNWLKRNA